ncbi:MAG: nucleotide exchange factor GrpE [Verrucomicrobia bacterium]|nr:nucleotide exchange factor GrpE [Verrucomicrobiota bacterium]
MILCVTAPEAFPYPCRDDEPASTLVDPRAYSTMDAVAPTRPEVAEVVEVAEVACEAAYADEADEADEACEADYADEAPSGITLDDLHEEMVATAAEARRGNRRMLEVLKNFGTVLDALSATVNDTHKAVRAIPAPGARPAEGTELPRDWALALVDLADRIERVSGGFSRPPAAGSSWWTGARKARAAWSEAWAMQADALGILRGHLAALLQRAGLKRLVVVGKPFDPHTMTALESAVDPAKPDHTVVAEMLPGWQHALTGQLVRPAQVRVSRIAAR